jgi:hypothetical protein
LQELLDEISICAVQFDPIKAGLHSVLSGPSVGFDDQRNLFSFECTRSLKRNSFEVSCKRLAGRTNRGGGNRERAIRIVAGMRNSADVPKLKEN